MPAEINETSAAAGEQQQQEQEQQQATTQTTESAAGGEQESQEQEQQTNPDGTPKPKVTGGFQKRIDKLTREKEFWKEQALIGARPAGTQAQQQQAETQTAAATAPAAEPKPDDFDTHAEYMKALAKYTVAEERKVIQAETARERAQAQQQTAEQTYQAKEKDYKGAVPDFDEVVAAADFPVSKAVVAEIVHGENGPALKYYLAQNPDEAERLNKLTPIQLAREVGRLEPRFKTAAKTSSSTTNAVSSAPRPVTPVGKASSTSTKDPGEMSPKEYREWRAKQYPNLY